MYQSTEDAQTTIVLQRMPQQLQAIDRRDDWTGVTDAATRRTLQNRHAQRIWRKKRLQQRVSSSASPESAQTLQKTESPTTAEVIRIRRDQITNYIPGRVCKNMLPDAQARLDFYARQAYMEYMLHAPRPAALHIVVQLNVHRALQQNASTLQLTREILCGSGSISPFNHDGPSRLDANFPLSLRPTAAQISIRHRPWIDLFPLPELRDAIIKLSWSDLENEISSDLLDVDDTDGVKPNLIVWGDASDPKAWEATVPFLKKWGWLAKGCVELIDSTNYWRERRGDRRLVFEVD